MITYKSYKQLPKNIKSLATQYCVEQLLKSAKVIQISQFHRLLLAIEESNREVQKEIKQGWWYKKSEGIPIGKTSRIAQLSKIYPCASRALLHPLWWLLGRADWSDENQLADIMLRLNTAISKYFVVVDNQGAHFKKRAFDNIKYIQNNIDLDMLTAYLILYLYQKYHTKNTQQLINIEVLSFNLTIKLLCFDFFLINQFNFFTALKVMFNSPESPTKESLGVPYLYSHIKDKQQLMGLCRFYFFLIQDISTNIWPKKEVHSALTNIPTLKQLNSMGKYPAQVYENFSSDLPYT